MNWRIGSNETIWEKKGSEKKEQRENYAPKAVEMPVAAEPIKRNMAYAPMDCELPIKPDAHYYWQDKQQE